MEKYNSLLALLSVIWGTTNLLPGINGQLWNQPHPCDRPCRPTDRRMICEFSLVVTFSRTFNPATCGNCTNGVPADCYARNCSTGDGITRPLFLTNNQFPGPELRVCENDILIINVTNMALSGESLAMHWHGLHHDKTPWMDGAQMITQCDIAFGQTFQYKFEAYPPGTKFWHAHSALLRDQGVAGGLLIRNKFPRSGPAYPVYENDQNRLAVVQDWTPVLTPPYFVRGTAPTVASLVVNGRQGQARTTNETFSQSPPSYFVFRPRGQLPYLRVVSNGFLHCPISLTIEGHRLILVEVDGFPVAPITVDKVYLLAAERFDFFLEPRNPQAIVQGTSANQSMIFHMQWVGDGVCRNTTAAYVGNATSYLIYSTSGNISLSSALALMRQKQDLDRMRNRNQLTFANSDLPPQSRERVLNPVHKIDFNTNPAYVRMTDLRALRHSYQKPLNNPKHKFYLFVDSYIGNVLPNVDNISYTGPTSPLLTQFNDVPKEEFCSLAKNPECSTQFCFCVHLYPRIDLDSVVEIVIVDEGNNLRVDSHAFHLHGYTFAVLGSERLGPNFTIADVKRRDQANLLKRNFQAPIYKDTVGVPDYGYTIIRFKADNPGFWMFHCHLGMHLLGGMGIILQVGNLNQMKPAPPGFPRCGNYLARGVNL